VGKGGVVVCAGIHMSEVPAFPYDILWGERVVRSVANLTRRDGLEFLELVPKIPVRTQAHSYPLEEVNRALSDLREGRFSGSAVVTID
jgi:propanol-preferring alcohol dehydrogenase